MRAVITGLALIVAGCGFDATGGPTGDDEPDDPTPPGPLPRYASCHAALAAGQTTSAVYNLAPDVGVAFDAYCDMTTAGGGWTLAIKADGSQPTFAYDEPVWTSGLELNPGSPDHDRAEAVLPTYTRLPATEVLIQSDDGHLVMPLGGGSLFEMIAPGHEQELAMSEYAWAPVVPTSQAPACSQVDGLNLDSSGYKARIGVLAKGWDDDGCRSDAEVTIGVGLAFDDSCELSSHRASVGHVVGGCTVADPFVYVYVR